MFSLVVEVMRLEPYKLNVLLLEEKLRKWITKVYTNQNFSKTLFINLIHIVCLSGIEALEKKAFEVCDEDGNGGLTWEEVEKCEVRLLVCTFLKMNEV